MMNEVITYLANYAYNHGAGIEFTQLDPDSSSYYISECKLIIINTNCHKQTELPFILGHEIGHYMNGDNRVSYYSCDGNAQVEHNANLVSIHLLRQYCISRGIYFDNPMTFVTQFGIPEKFLDEVIKSFNSDCDLI